MPSSHRRRRPSLHSSDLSPGRRRGPAAARSGGGEVPPRQRPLRRGPPGELAMCRTHPFARSHQEPSAAEARLYAHPLRAASEAEGARRVCKRGKTGTDPKSNWLNNLMRAAPAFELGGEHRRRVRFSSEPPAGGIPRRVPGDWSRHVAPAASPASMPQRGLGPNEVFACRTVHTVIGAGIPDGLGSLAGCCPADVGLRRRRRPHHNADPFSCSSAPSFQSAPLFDWLPVT